MDVCRNEKCGKPITYPQETQVLKFSETRTLSVRCPHCGTLNTKTVSNKK